MMLLPKPSILFIDAYDSFTNNIVALLSTTLSCTVRVIHIDTPGLETGEALRKELQNYDAVVCGPGPGHPLNEKDVGIMKRIWRLADEDLLPVLGICLGFQSLAAEYGGEVRKLNQGLHGMVRRIHHIGEDKSVPECWRSATFDGVGKVEATLYHSLCVYTGTEDLSQDEFNHSRWAPDSKLALLQPLAWIDEPGMKDKRVLMAVKHITKPFWGLQYHPESACTNAESNKIIRNWFREAQLWNSACGRQIKRNCLRLVGCNAQRSSLLSITLERKTRETRERILPEVSKNVKLSLKFRTWELPDNVGISNIIQALHLDTKQECILLESTNANASAPQPGRADVRGRYSIIGLNLENSYRFEYTTDSTWFSFVTTDKREENRVHRRRVDLELHETIWEVLTNFADKRKVEHGNPETPFWGGFMGFVSYELGLEDIGVARSHAHHSSGDPSDGQSTRPDLNFAWITLSLVVDHWEKKIHLQCLSPATATSPREFMLASDKLSHLVEHGLAGYIVRDSPLEYLKIKSVSGQVLRPNSVKYQRKVEECQAYIRDGEAYELCLTDQTHIIRKRSDPIHEVAPAALHQRQAVQGSSSRDAWDIYQKLRARQPAPMASFIRLGSATFISASPERFLKWSTDGKCELRPMKGTVKKTDEVYTLSQAESLLQVPKEQAENLMIVDLVRHDLHGVCGAGNVQVPRLMVVEEYASVFQMITVVEGQLPKALEYSDDADSEAAARARYTGIDVLAASLPPGSMTGAPKKRSCEILQSIEGGYDRSLYSGVVGYIDVGGRGDFSVNIRCLFRWDDEVIRPGEGNIKDRLERLSESELAKSSPKEEIWHVGAGGAVTALSTPLGEREEMQTKLNGTLSLFPSAREAE